MTASALAYAAWLTTTAAQAEHTANAARAAAAAYESARAATVPPALVAANRAQLRVLVATNLLGQNTPAIAALEAQYLEMWAQDTAAMAHYQANSAAAAQLSPFTAPSQISHLAAKPQSATTAGIAQEIVSLLNPNNVPIFGLDNGSLLGQYLQSFLSSGPYDVPLSLLALFSNLWAFSAPGTAIADALNNIATADAHAGSPGGPPATPTAAASSTVRASVGTAARLGRLCAPSWTQPAPGGQPPPATAARPAAAAETPAALPLPAPIPVPRGGTPPKQPRPQPEYGGLVRFITRPPAGG